DRPRRRTQAASRRATRQHAQPRGRLRLSPRQSHRRDDPDRRRPRGAARLLRAPLHRAADLAADGHAARRRDRKRRLARARRSGDRLRPISARMAAFQPRRRLDHARDRDPAPGHRPLPPRRSVSAFTIAYEDEHLLVVDKGPGLVVHPARGHRDDTLAQLLAGSASGGDPERAGIVHRLHRDTSRLLVVSRPQKAHTLVPAALAKRLIEREYLALVQGRPPARSGTIEAPIGRDPRVRTRMAVGGAHAREARTHFELERALADTSLLRLRLETGRTHQIRVHLRAIGHPVAGDPEYGTAGLLGLERQFLHATRLAFHHPLTSERVEVRSPLPPDLQAALARAEELS